MPVHTYTNWNSRPSDQEEKIEPYRKYFFICEGANTETFYFRHLIDIRKQLGIHPLIDVRLWEKTGEDLHLSRPRKLFEFSKEQKKDPANGFDASRDKMIIVFDGDVFEKNVQGYDDLIKEIEEKDIVAVSNPAFELFLLLHIKDSYELYIKDNESKFMTGDENGAFKYAYQVLRDVTGYNSKRNPRIGELADNVMIAIEQEKLINQDVHQLKGKVSCNVAKIISEIINESPA